MTAKPCEFCGQSLDGMRADARFHPECKDADRRERERPSLLRDRLRREYDALVAEALRLDERVIELLERHDEVRRAARGIKRALDLIDRKPRKGLWRLLREIWTPSSRDEHPELSKGRTNAETGGS